tara:strand:+ start:1652 stop:2299 length:648 start_codon:yes stop_codon:yes gene_type:complete
MDVKSELRDAQLELVNGEKTHSVNKKGMVWFDYSANKIKAFFNATIKELVTSDELGSTVDGLPKIISQESEIQISPANTVVNDISGDRLSWTDIPGLSLSVTHGGGPMYINISNDFEHTDQFTGNTTPSRGHVKFQNAGSVGVGHIGIFVGSQLIDTTSVYYDSSQTITIKPTMLIQSAGTYTVKIRFKHDATHFGGSTTPTLRYYPMKLKVLHT